jgi:hypothetical protein
MPIPASTQTSLAQRLQQRRRERWPSLTRVSVRVRGNFAYISGTTTDNEELALCRLRYGGSASQWGFAIYLASKDGYEDSVLPNGMTAGAPEEALDCACGLYLNDVTAWTNALDDPPPDSPKNF